MARIIAVCRSDQKGTKKQNIEEGFLREDFGLVGDAHADCCTHRQVSLLAIESIDKMRNLGLDVGPGDFAENLTIEGLDLMSLPVGARVSVGEEVILEITQIGKECHVGCAIFRQVGKCIMPKEGVFSRVIRGGTVKVGDCVEIKSLADKTRRLSIWRVTQQGRSSVDDTVVREFSLTIVLNGQELVTLLCSPADLEYLTAGYLLSQALIVDKDDIRKMVVGVGEGVAWVETVRSVDVSVRPVLASSGAKDAVCHTIPKVNAKPETKVSTHQVSRLMKDFMQKSKVFKDTGGVHSAALCDTAGILVFSEDIGRHNAIDKVFGRCLLEDIITENRLMVTSGRVSSEILLKVARRNVPILVSKAAPTDLGVKLADDLGVTLVGFARGRAMNVYSHDWRIVADE
ncbi:MAG TPA: formate dehydrogenase accessory sulfurtransferase FdhD [Dehalococcoidia bacterium]|nr:formate dehydrogenase accessory sulfurtransferase FdhD [Dehalococcoidia bacterium]